MFEMHQNDQKMSLWWQTNFNPGTIKKKFLQRVLCYLPLYKSNAKSCRLIMQILSTRKKCENSEND